MIDAEYVRLMARYNFWQNVQLMPILEDMSDTELTKDRGSFFGSLFATANHLLWGDTIWMSRFDKAVAPPKGGIPESVGLHATLSAWAADRRRLDGTIRLWAERLASVDIEGSLTWYSGALGREVSAPKASTIMHFFNHQTHHRGQIHAMLTAAGNKAPVTDLFIMPEDV